VFLVYPQLPRAGLGNMLFVWARAVLFAQLNSIPVIAPNWGTIKIGPYLRGERDKRDYGSFFSQRYYASKYHYFLRFLLRQNISYNPAISKIDLSNLEPNLFIFNSLPHWSDYFIDLKEHQLFIKHRLVSSLRESVFKSIFSRVAPEIGIHIRMGDFKVLKPGDDFTQLGNVRTPINWYIGLIYAIREVAKFNVPVTLFSDGHDEELSELLKLPNISRPPLASALSDLLTLSRSKLLITSSGSTFSSWASYLGQCPTIWHPAHFHAGVFPEQLRNHVFEGGFDPESMTFPELLNNNIQKAFENSYV